jgi:hypothetical protein
VKAVYGEVGEIKELRSTGVCRIAIEVPAEAYKSVVAMLHGQKVLLTVAPPIHAPYGVVEPERVVAEDAVAEVKKARRAARARCRSGRCSAARRSRSTTGWRRRFPRRRYAHGDARDAARRRGEEDHLLRVPHQVAQGSRHQRALRPRSSTNSSAGPTRMNKADREYARDAVSLGCALCRRLGWGETPAQFHHPRTGVGAARKAPDADGIPLCWEHHQGSTGVHGMGRKAFEKNTV